MHWRDDAVEITVVNRMSPAHRSRSSTGHGLIGMRERAHATGGAFSAGPTPDGLFAVHVTLPSATHPPITSAPAGNPTVLHREVTRKDSLDGD